MGEYKGFEYEYDSFYDGWFLYDENGIPFSRVFDSEAEIKQVIDGEVA